MSAENCHPTRRLLLSSATWILICVMVVLCNATQVKSEEASNPQPTPPLAAAFDRSVFFKEGEPSDWSVLKWERPVRVTLLIDSPLTLETFSKIFSDLTSIRNTTHLDIKAGGDRADFVIVIAEKPSAFLIQLQDKILPMFETKDRLARFLTLFNMDGAHCAQLTARAPDTFTIADYFMIVTVGPNEKDQQVAECITQGITTGMGMLGQKAPTALRAPYVGHVDLTNDDLDVLSALYRSSIRSGEKRADVIRELGNGTSGSAAK